MIERSCRHRLSYEPLFRLLVGNEVRGDKLQRHRPSQLDVLSFVDDTHPAFAEFAVNAVVGDALANHKRHAASAAPG